MTCINVEIDNEYFMVKVERISTEIPQCRVSVIRADQQGMLYMEEYLFEDEKYRQQFELDFDKRDAKKLIKRYLKFR